MLGYVERDEYSTRKKGYKGENECEESGGQDLSAVPMCLRAGNPMCRGESRNDTSHYAVPKRKNNDEGEGDANAAKPAAFPVHNHGNKKKPAVIIEAAALRRRKRPRFSQARTAVFKRVKRTPDVYFFDEPHR
jgi:hypothetical protein